MSGGGLEPHSSKLAFGPDNVRLPWPEAGKDLSVHFVRGGGGDVKPRLYFTYNGLRSSETHHYKRRPNAPWDEPTETRFELHREPPIAGDIELPADGDFVVQVTLFGRHFYTPEDAANDGVDVHAHECANRCTMRLDTM